MFLSRVLLAQSPAERIREYMFRDARIRPRLYKHPRLTPIEVETHEKLFRQFDKNKDTYLNKKELNSLVRHRAKEYLNEDFDINKLLRTKSAVEIYLRGRFKNFRVPAELSTADVEYYEKLFNFFDRNGDKHLNIMEYSQLVRHQCGDIMTACCDTEKPFNKMDLNGDHKISIQEYLDHIANSKKKLPLNKHLQEMFNLYDGNADAHINLDEFRQILLYMGEDFTRSDLRHLFVSVDADKDGLIDVFQFLELINQKLRQT